MDSVFPALSFPPTWADLAALPSHFLGVTAGILGGAGHTVAVLVAIHTCAQDARHGAEGEHSRVPHVPMGVCLPIVCASWNTESREEGGRVSAPGLANSSSKCRVGPECTPATLRGKCRLRKKTCTLTSSQYLSFAEDGKPSPGLRNSVMGHGECWPGSQTWPFQAGKAKTAVSTSGMNSTRSSSPPCLPTAQDVRVCSPWPFLLCQGDPL